MGDTVDIVDTEVTVDTAVDTEDMVDTVAREKLKLNQKLPLLLLQKLMPKLGALLDTDTVPDMVLADMEVTVLALPAMEVTVLDMVSGRDLLMPKPGVLLDTDTVPDMVLVDMEVTVLALPAMEVTVLDTVSGRDLLTPGMDADMEAMVDTAVDMEVMVDTDTLDMHTESKFCISMPLLPFILLYLLKHNVNPFLQEKQTKLSFNMFHQKLRKSF